jgi:hypothetical protein
VERDVPFPGPPSTYKYPENEPLSSFTSGGPTERDAHPLSPPPHNLSDPIKRAALQVPVKEHPQRETFHFPRPPSTISQTSNYTNHAVSPTGPLQTEKRVSRALFYTSSDNPRFPQSTTMFPIKFPIKRDAPSLEPIVYSLIYIYVRFPS